jgi:hypothetical protein
MGKKRDSSSTDLLDVAEGRPGSRKMSLQDGGR